MATYLEIASDIQLDLKQALDDAEVPMEQLYWWMTIVGNRLLGQHIQKKFSKGLDRRESGGYLSSFVLDITTDATNGRKYITIPRTIFDFDQDGGVDHLVYYTTDTTVQQGQLHKVHFYRTSQRELRTLENSTYQRPSAKTPYYYRLGNRLYLTGIEGSPGIVKVEIGLHLTLPPLTTITDDTEFPFPEELVYVLKRHILDLGRWNLLMPEERRLNDATARDQQAMQQAPPKTLSVNDPSIQQDQ